MAVTLPTWICHADVTRQRRELRECIFITTEIDIFACGDYIKVRAVVNAKQINSPVPSQGAPAFLEGPLGIFFGRPLWISFWE